MPEVKYRGPGPETLLIACGPAMSTALPITTPLIAQVQLGQLPRSTTQVRKLAVRCRRLIRWMGVSDGNSKRFSGRRKVVEQGRR